MPSSPPGLRTEQATRIVAVLYRAAAMHGLHEALQGSSRQASAEVDSVSKLVRYGLLAFELLKSRSHSSHILLFGLRINAIPSRCIQPAGSSLQTKGRRKAGPHSMLLRWRTSHNMLQVLAQHARPPARSAPDPASAEHLPPWPLPRQPSQGLLQEIETLTALPTSAARPLLP